MNEQENERGMNDKVWRFIIIGVQLVIAVLGVFIQSTLNRIDSQLDDHEKRIQRVEQVGSTNAQTNDYILKILEVRLDNMENDILEIKELVKTKADK